MKVLNKIYEPQKIENKIYKKWLKSGYFNPDNLKKHSGYFSIIMPPPNANGSLHLGHAVFITLEDIMIRFWRMRGKKALWVPGADHAGFETQVVFDKKLEKEGKSRFDFSNEELFRQIWDFTQKNKKLMENQIKQLGASCDWSREKFTLDKNIVKIVYDTFYKLFEDGLAYRDLKVINWCPKHKTALSDLETKYVERKDKLYYIKYGPLTVATVRPETKFGDTALAVNPNDKRYKDFIGKEIEARDVLGKIKIKIIADEAVDPQFGTGVVKVTPAHDPQDFEIWQRHKNEIPGPKIVIDENGRLTDLTGPYAGMKTSEARDKIAEDLEKLGLIEKIDDSYTHNITVCYKCGNTLEAIPKMQWFVKMTTPPKGGKYSLKDLAVFAVKSKKIKFFPQRFEKVFYHWMKNIRDWNISRQIIWGIRIPAFYCGEGIFDFNSGEIVYKNGCGKIILEDKKPAKCPQCGSKNIISEKDVFDTWFSSGQWPFAVLVYPKDKDFKKFYPTSVMETGWDILFFWVTRMIMLGLYRTGKVPFEKVYLHGLVLDKDKQKMSKSKGNVIDPLGVVELYGADALRMALVIGNTPGRDIVISEEKIKAYRNFATKIWNIARFILMNKNKNYKLSNSLKKKIYSSKEMKDFQKVKKLITKEIEGMKFYLAAEKLYHYIWHTFADKIIEKHKLNFKEGNDDKKIYSYYLLEEIFCESLKCLHPFMPFITEELYGYFRNNKILLIENW